MTREEMLVGALQKIADLDPSVDSLEGYNEWGEADCFSQAKTIARGALEGTSAGVCVRCGEARLSGEHWSCGFCTRCHDSKCGDERGCRA